jgi:hypothetical protein
MRSSVKRKVQPRDDPMQQSITEVTDRRFDKRRLTDVLESFDVGSMLNRVLPFVQIGHPQASTLFGQRNDGALPDIVGERAAKGTGRNCHHKDHVRFSFSRYLTFGEYSCHEKVG